MESQSEFVPFVVNFYNMTWMLASFVAAAGLTYNVLLNSNASKAARGNVKAWVATLLAIAIHRLFWLIAGLTDDPKTSWPYGEWAGYWRWALVIPIVGDVLITLHFVLRRMAGLLWYIAGLSTIPVSLLVTILLH